MSIFNLFKPNIKKLKTKKKVKPLIKALKYNKDWNVRKSAAEALIAIGWEPILVMKGQQIEPKWSPKMINK